MYQKVGKEDECMGIKIKSSYLFLLDNYKCEFVRTEQPMDDRKEGPFEFLRKSMEKCLKNAAIRPGVFVPESEGRQLFLDYRNHAISFLEYATEVAHRRYEYKKEAELEIATDLFLCEVEITKGKDEEAIDAVIGLELTCKEGMLHTVQKGESGVMTNLEAYNSIVPSVTLKNASFFMINLEEQTVSILENEIHVNGDIVRPYAEEILGCEMEISAKEAIQTSMQLTRKVAKEFGLDHLKLVPTMERVMKETVNEGEDLDFKILAEEVIYENEQACDKFLKGIEQLGIKKPVKNTKHVKLPIKKMQKITTDCGIEINIPLDFYTNEDIVKVNRLEDGRLSIEIKNLNAVENK